MVLCLFCVFTLFNKYLFCFRLGKVCDCLFFLNFQLSVILFVTPRKREVFKVADNKCYTVVEFDKWKSHSEIVNKNNHNFRVNPVDVLNPAAAIDNEVIKDSNSHVKERWINLVKILEDEMKKVRPKNSSLTSDEYKRLTTGNAELR